MMGKMDPYVIFKCNGVEKRSPTVDNGGKHPVWKRPYVFTVDVQDLGDDLYFECYDKDLVGSDDAIGKGHLKLASICCLGGFEEWPEV